ncbi:hypothetical protein N5E15_12660, partial [Pantoea stewartii]|uniref:hypothetical protein n=2 Tax=Pantoea stewartii TaxID=66269 RepID=UPI0021D4BA3C
MSSAKNIKKNSIGRNAQYASFNRYVVISVRYLRRMCCFLPRSFKNESLSHFFIINACHPERTPYNAPPLTRHNGLRNAVFSRELPGVFAGEKLLKKRLTLKEESVIYATSQQTVNPLVALLFNNLSDNLCGHSQ